jgi:hypothetical protein
VFEGREVDGWEWGEELGEESKGDWGGESAEKVDCGGVGCEKRGGPGKRGSL